jgi:hypothetical protein
VSGNEPFEDYVYVLLVRVTEVFEIETDRVIKSFSRIRMSAESCELEEGIGSVKGGLEIVRLVQPNQV